MIHDEKEYPIPRLPNPLTEDGLRNLMRERPYWDLKHPSSPLYQRLVAQGFAFLFPGKMKHDETGKAIDVSPLPPEAVAHQVAQVNREMDRLERQLQGGSGGGAVHVRAHARDGGKTQVSDYWRAAPGSGNGESEADLPKRRNLLEGPESKPEPLGRAHTDEDPRDVAVNMADDTPSDEKDENDKSRTDDDRTKESRSRLPAPDSREPVDPEEFYRNIGFDPNGNQEWQVVLRRPVDAHTAAGLATEAENVAKNEFPESDLLNDEGDAFRHAHWSFQMTRQIGPDAAKDFSDAHERSHPNPVPERLMDLYNNKVGRDLALDPENADRDGREVIREAIRNGNLRTAPFETQESEEATSERPSGYFPSD